MDHTYPAVDCIVRQAVSNPFRINLREDQYIRLIIAKHRVKSAASSNALQVAKQLFPLIRKWAGNYLSRIHTTGSFAKGTNIIGTTDIDLFISLRSTTPYALDEIYGSLSNYIRKKGYSIREQNVSIRVHYKNLVIDLVPAKKQQGPTYDHSIYLRKGDTWTKTNVRKHVLLVKNSGRLKEIRAIKIWRKLHCLEFPSFCLELSVIKALRGHRSLKISSNLLTVFKYFSDNFENERVIDPSNSNNIVSDDLNNEEKQTIKSTALSSLSKSYWDQIIW